MNLTIQNFNSNIINESVFVKLFNILLQEAILDGDGSSMHEG